LPVTGYGANRQNADRLVSLILPEELATIGNYVFAESTGLVSVEMPGLTSIGGYSFYGCAALRSVDLSGLTGSTGSQSFSGCTALTSVTLPASLTITKGYFKGCVNITFTVAGTGGNLSTALDGTLLIHDGIYLVCAASAAGAVTVPAGITTIVDYAFFGNTAMTSVTIPASVNDMSGQGIFEGCANLASADLSASTITSLGSASNVDGQMFKGCASLKTVLLPSTLATIGYYTFSGCSALESIELSASVASIRNLAFEYCTSLVTIIVRRATPPTMNNNTFSNTHADLLIYVPDDSVDAYKTANGWKSYEDKIKGLSEYAE
jgi:hypothetical protein